MHNIFLAIIFRFEAQIGQNTGGEPKNEKGDPFDFQYFFQKIKKKYFALTFGYIPNFACTIYSWQLFFDWKPRSAKTLGANPTIKKGTLSIFNIFTKK